METSEMLGGNAEMGTRVLVPQIRSERDILVKDVAKALGISRQAAAAYAHGERLPSDPEKFVAFIRCLGLHGNSRFAELFPELPQGEDGDH